MLTVLNKVDGLTLPDGRSPESEADLPALVLSNAAPGGEGTVPVSALRGWGIEALRRRIAYDVLGVGVESGPPAFR